MFVFTDRPGTGLPTSQTHPVPNKDFPRPGQSGPGGRGRPVFILLFS